MISSLRRRPHVTGERYSYIECIVSECVEKINGGISSFGYDFFVS